MDDTLQRLLEAEVKAERLAKEAEAQHEATIQSAYHETRELDEQFSDRIPQIQSAWLDRSAERASKTIAEIERRYGERHEQLRDVAESREDEALGAAFQVLLDTRL